MSSFVGVDLVDIEEIAESVRIHGERYLERVFTGPERRASRDRPGQLAERFAAKEATMKALACPERLPWQSIAVTVDGARPRLSLSGAAAELARRRGIHRLSVSVARVRAHALAVVLASTG